MVDFRSNADIVLSTLERYRYGPRAISIAKKCFDELSAAWDGQSDHRFSAKFALSWCNTARISEEIRQPYEMNIYRLDDVYRIGHVSGKRIRIYAHPSEPFLCIINDYLDHVEKNGDYSPIHISNIRRVVKHFCCFVQYNGVKDPKDISYRDIDAYDSFMRESSKAFYINEGLVVGFLKHLAGKWESKSGFPLYLHYLESDHATSLADLTENSQRTIVNIQKDCCGLSALEFHNTISSFVDCLKDQSYSRQFTEYTQYCLTILFLFLDRSELRYDRTTVELWFQEKGKALFKTGVLEARRAYELYDDYTRNGCIDPRHRWKHSETQYDKLPNWCREQVQPFVAAKEKEEWEANTIKMYRTCATVLCRFLVNFGIKSFDEVTAAMIKEFNAQDDGHRTPEAKNAYNGRIRKFLIYLEINGVLPAGIYKSLPHSAASCEKIVEILSEDDKHAIADYCMNAATPLQLRDAAMLMLLIETALRACDIAALEATDIDWKQMGIRIVQKKTRVEHLHPLSAKTMNCLFRYIKEARKPNTGCTEIFLKLRAPYEPVGRTACRDALIRAGVSTGRTHLTRRSYATSLLRGGATITETAEMLGHTDTSSVHKYTLLDSERMRLCPLSLSETGLLLKGRYRHG